MWARQNAQMVAGAVLLAGATLPLVALASGEAGAMDPATAAGGGVIVTTALGLVGVAIKALVDRRGPDGHAATQTTGPSAADAQQSVALAELRTEQRHLATRVDRNEQLHDRSRDDIAEATRAIDRLDGRLATMDERVAEVVAELRALLAELRSGSGQG